MTVISSPTAPNCGKNYYVMYHLKKKKRILPVDYDTVSQLKFLGDSWSH